MVTFTPRKHPLTVMDAEGDARAAAKKAGATKAVEDEMVRAAIESVEPDGYEFEGPTRFDKLFTGLAVERPKSLVLGDRTGCEHISPPFDDDYGRLLDRVYVKGSTSPAGFEPALPA
jgi:hypothetical protein